MNSIQTTPERLAPEPLPANIGSVQPGGGTCYQIELAWGRLRRWYLKTFRRGYVQRMERLRQGDVAGCPHEVLDPRDLKFFRNQCAGGWHEHDDPFRWRQRIPFARWGLAELQLMGWPLLAITVLLAMTFWYLAPIPAVLLALVVYFFRDPPRSIPQGAGDVVAPADGRIVEVTRLEHDEYLGGPAVRVGIFLSIFNVHINRAPVECRVIRLRYHPGEFLNALNPASLERNEAMWIGLEEEAAPHRRLVVRQIAGLLARRIVCDLRPGQVVARGKQIGMIKLGSRTEMLLPDEPGLEVLARVGQKVQAGATLLARWPTEGRSECKETRA